MTVGFSTSSPQASVAIFSGKNDLIWSGAEVAPNAASGALVRLLRSGLDASGISLAEVKAFVADLGPGSFTGVRVGIVFAKAIAMESSALVGGANAFDLIDACHCVYVPSRKGEVFVRKPGEEPYRSETTPPDAKGYEYGKPGTYPLAAQFGLLLSKVKLIKPEQLVPAYLTEPSISLPKRPYGELRA